MLRVVITNQFKKDFKKFKHDKKVHEKFEEVLFLLSHNKKLPKALKDHKLSGNFIGLREYHLFPDVLFVYEKEEKKLILSCIRIGSHSQLF